MNQTAELLMRHRIVVIYRGVEPRDCIEASRALMETGIRCFEVTFNSRDTTGTIRMLGSELGSDACIGAGTVRSPEQVNQAADAGAKYIVSPNFNPEVVERSKERGLASVPGAFTPTEVEAAWRAGADLVKVFPINVVGARYITQLRGPLDDIPLLITGGINDPGLVRELFDAGSMAVGMSVQLFGKELVASRNWSALAEKASEFVEAAGIEPVASAVRSGS